MDKHVNDAMAWMNGKINQQNSQDLTLDPVVKVGEIRAKAKVFRKFKEKLNTYMSQCSGSLLSWSSFWNIFFDLRQPTSPTVVNVVCKASVGILLVYV